MKARVFVTLKNGILDAQGKTITKSLNSTGFDNVQSVRQGKCFDVTLAVENAESARVELENICSRVLANPVIEDYEFELVD